MERVGLLILLVAAVAAQNSSEVVVTRTGCGVTKLCVETPDDCDPAASGTCLFASVDASAPVAPNGINLSVQLRGESEGYVALGLTVNASVGTTQFFICGQDSSRNATFFLTALRDNVNNTISPAILSVTGGQVSVKDNVIRCVFNVLNVNATRSPRVRSSHVTTFTLLLVTGRFNGNNISEVNVDLNSGPVNLVDPASNVMTTATPNLTTTASGASGGGRCHGVILLLSILWMVVRLTA